MKKIFFSFWLTFALSIIFLNGNAQGNSSGLAIAGIFSDNMILQREVKIPVWGWAIANEDINISFKGKNYTTKSSANGKWRVDMDASEAGGPFELSVSNGKNKIGIKNILVGEVWLCSGQSNMVLAFNDARLKSLYKHDIAQSTNNEIRQFLVNRTAAAYESPDMKANGWQSANPSSIIGFSAAAYFFGLELYNKLHVPIGLINSSYGGTVIEAWTSEMGIRKFDQFSKALAYYKDTAQFNKYIKEYPGKVKQWNEAIENGDKGLDKNKTPVWAQQNIDDNEWQTVKEPQFLPGWSIQTPYFGSSWLRKKFIIPDNLDINQNVELNLGYIINEDIVYVNGKEVGSTKEFRAKRVYKLPKDVLRKGENLIVIRIINYNTDMAGFNPHSDLFISVGNEKIPLGGEDWKFQKGYTTNLTQPVGYDTKNFPTALYNAMIAPLVPYAIRGVIWYQGEFNTARAYEYRDLFPNMIADWKSKWGREDLPFIFQQLPNFQNPSAQPGDHPWAELREAQSFTLGKVKNTGMSVSIDLGGDGDLHPVNKKDIGKRLALQAEKLAYNMNIVASGPIYTSMNVDGNKIILHFNETGSGLTIRDGRTLKGFAIAGQDKKFKWADAQIIGNTVVVSSSEISNPAAVRYAWASNPEGCNLYNKEGLPASPFRTDSWKGITEGKVYSWNK